MSEYFFGQWWGRVTGKWRNRAEAIAKRHGAWFGACNADIPGAHALRGWMCCRNRGAPFDTQTARAVIEDLEGAGLWADDQPKPPPK